MSSEPSSPRSVFGIRFSLLARRWRQILDARLARVGLTDATWVPLIHLKETGGGITQKELALRLGIDGSSLVRVLDILVREGLIERRRDETDGRARLISLTGEGVRRVGEIQKHLAREEEEMLADLSDADVGELLRYFATLEQRMASLEEGCRKDTVE